MEPPLADAERDVADQQKRIDARDRRRDFLENRHLKPPIFGEGTMAAAKGKFTRKRLLRGRFAAAEGIADNFIDFGSEPLRVLSCRFSFRQPLHLSFAST